MIPYELTLRNFMCYRGNGDDPDHPLTLKLDGIHIACLSGENGAGKSALLDAITWALWGKARMSDDELIAQGESEMLVDLCFQLDGQSYRVIRRRQRARSGARSSGKSHLDFQVRSDQLWRSLSEHKISETEQKIEQLLRMKYDTFINASFLLQNRADEFTRKTAGERKQVLADILDLREYARLEERARQRAKKLGDAITGLDGLIGHLQQEADKLSFYDQIVAEGEHRVAILTSALESAETDQRAADAQVQALEAKLERRKQVSASLAKLRAEQRDQEQKATELRLKIAEDEAMLQREAEIAAGVQALAAARDKLARLDSLVPRYNELQDQLRQLREAYAEARRQLQSELDAERREQQRLQDLVASRPAVQTALADLEQRLAALAPLAAALQSLRAQHADLDERIHRINDLLRQRSDLINQIEKRQDSLVGVREEQKRVIARLERQLKDVTGWRADLEAALAQQQTLREQSAQLAALREQDRATTERAGELRALCRQYQQQADQVKQRKALLHDTSLTACPLCGSDLGHDGVTTIVRHYDQEVADLRERYRACKRDADNLEADLSTLRDQMRELETQVSAAQQGAARVEMLQQQLTQAGEWQEEYAQAQARLVDVEQQFASADYEPEARLALRRVEAELADLHPDLANQESSTRDKPPKRTSDFGSAVLSALSRERATLKQQQSDLEQQLNARSGIEARIANHRRELVELEQVTSALPALEQRVAALSARIEHGDFAHDTRSAGETLKAELAALGYTPETRQAAYEQVEQLMHWADAERCLIEAQSRIASNRSALDWAAEMLARRAAEIDQCTREDALLEQDLRDLPAARQHAAACASATSAGRRELDVARRDLHEKQTLRAKSQEAAEQLGQKQEERRALIDRQGVFQELSEACGKKGVQAMLIETAIPEIEREANRLLGRMTDNQMHLTFEMQRDTKKGDIVETLEIKIGDALGTRTYDAFSGGEAMRVNFAIRVALSRLLARRAGASLETLVIDEGFGALDAQGRERFVEAITSVQHDFKRILVITHLDELKERFPAQIEITKTASGSVWTLV